MVDPVGEVYVAVVGREPGRRRREDDVGDEAQRRKDDDAGGEAVEPLVAIEPDRDGDQQGGEEVREPEREGGVAQKCRWPGV
jgi:hypothetical protein